MNHLILCPQQVLIEDILSYQGMQDSKSLHRKVVRSYVPYLDLASFYVTLEKSVELQSLEE